LRRTRRQNIRQYHRATTVRKGGKRRHTNFATRRMGERSALNVGGSDRGGYDSGRRVAGETTNTTTRTCVRLRVNDRRRCLEPLRPTGPNERDGVSSVNVALNCHASHIFHLGCVATWLHKRAVCPLCCCKLDG
jgi:hypothetical protein